MFSIESESLEKKLKNLSELSEKGIIQVGVFNGKQGKIANIHEYGRGYIPKRSFIREPLKSNSFSDFFLRAYDKALKKYIRGAIDFSQFTAQLGLKVVGFLQENIYAGNIKPKLSRKTILRKGSRTPLFNKGNLVKSIKYKIKYE